MLIFNFLICYIHSLKHFLQVNFGLIVGFDLGLTIDVVTSIIVIISIGLCVDYSAHIAHAFLTSQGMQFKVIDIP